MMGSIARRSRHGLVALLLLLGGGCARAPATPGVTSGRASPVAIGAPLPPLVLNDLSTGAPVPLASLEGKVVLLDLWASWCAPCQEELPLLDDMAKRLEGKGVAVVAVSVDEERAKAMELLGRRDHWTLRAAHDPEGKVPSALEPAKMPTSYVLDRRGILRAIHAGFERGDAAHLESELTRLADAG